MRTKHPTKRAWLASLLSLVLCAALLIGTTFAWFTDNDTTAVSNIVFGTLDIEIVDAEGNPKTDALKFVAKDGRDTILWEPGATYRTEGFQIKNIGNLWLKYTLKINNTETSYNKLNEAIKFSLVKADGTKIDLATMKDISLAPNGGMNTEGVMYIEGYMDQNAGNEYQGLTMNGIAITVQATQATVEYDSFGNDYDAGAEYENGTDTTPDVVPEGVASISELISKIESNGSVYLTQDISDSSTTFNVGAGLSYASECEYDGNVVIDFNGKNIMFNSQKNAAFRVASGKTLTLNGSSTSQITVLGQQSHFYTFSIDSGKSVEQNKATSADGRIIINGGYYVQAAFDQGYNQPMFIVGQASSEAGAEIIINGGKFWNKQGDLFDVYATGDVVIYNGQFVDFNPSEGMNGVYFLAGQTSSAVPAGYTITSETITLSDGEHTLYTVTYAGN